MANSAASTKLGSGFGPISQNDVKTCCVAFVTTATGDILIFDASNVGIENAFSSIKYAHVIAVGGAVVATNTIASNQITIGTPVGATAVVAFVCGIGG